MKAIKEFPGYFITEDGFVFSDKGKGDKLRLIRANLDTQGYPKVTLRFEGTNKTRRISGLVAKAFLPQPVGTYLVRHVDGNPLNSHVSNLVWGTHEDNIEDRKRHGVQTGCVGAANFSAKLTSNDILLIRKRWDAGERAITIAEDYPVTSQQIGAIGFRKAWKSVPEAS